MGVLRYEYTIFIVASPVGSLCHTLSLLSVGPHPSYVFFKITQQNSWIFHINRPWVCAIKVCSNGGATYIICKITAKANLNTTN